MGGVHDTRKRHRPRVGGRRGRGLSRAQMTKDVPEGRRHDRLLRSVLSRVCTRPRGLLIVVGLLMGHR